MLKHTMILWVVFFLTLSVFSLACKDEGGTNLANFEQEEFDTALDEDESDSALNEEESDTALNAIVIFKIDTAVSGDFGTTHQTDCESAKSALELGGDNVKPFISNGLANEIKDIAGVPQTGVPVVSVAKTQLKADWSSLWTDDTLDVSLFTAGVLPNSTDSWWSGTYNNGQTGGGGANNCNGWTVTGANGQSGIANLTTQGWIWNGTDSCSNTNYRLCVAWD